MNMEAYDETEGIEIEIAWEAIVIVGALAVLLGILSLAVLSVLWDGVRAAFLAMFG